MISDKSKIAALILSKAAGSADEDGDSDKSSGDAGLEAAAEEMLTALEAKDASGLAQALRSAFQMMEAEPHEEAGEA